MVSLVTIFVMLSSSISGQDQCLDSHCTIIGEDTTNPIQIDASAATDRFILDCSKSGSCGQISFSIPPSGTTTIICGDQACDRAEFDFDLKASNATLICSGQDSCNAVKFEKISSNMTIISSGNYSCNEAEFRIKQRINAKLECTVPSDMNATNYGYACQNVRILGKGGDAQVAVNCNSTHGCTNMKIETESTASTTVNCNAES